MKRTMLIMLMVLVAAVALGCTQPAASEPAPTPAAPPSVVAPVPSLEPLPSSEPAVEPELEEDMFENDLDEAISDLEVLEELQ